MTQNSFFYNLRVHEDALAKRVSNVHLHQVLARSKSSLFSKREVNRWTGQMDGSLSRPALFTLYLACKAAWLPTCGPPGYRQEWQH